MAKRPNHYTVQLVYYTSMYIFCVKLQRIKRASPREIVAVSSTTNKISYPVYRYMYIILLAINVVLYNTLLQENVQRVSGNAKFSEFYEDGNIEVLSVIFKQRVLQNQVFLSNNKNELFSRVFTLKDNRFFFEMICKIQFGLIHYFGA